MIYRDARSSDMRHTVNASSSEHREQLISDLFNHFEMVENSDECVVLKRRAVSWAKQVEARDRSWFNRFLSLFGSQHTDAWPEPTEREKLAVASLPPGATFIEIRIEDGRS